MVHELITRTSSKNKKEIEYLEQLIRNNNPFAYTNYQIISYDSSVGYIEGEGLRVSNPPNDLFKPQLIFLKDEEKSIEVLTDEVRDDRIKINNLIQQLERKKRNNT